MRKSLLITLDFSPALGGVSNYLLNISSRLNPLNLVVLTLPHDLACDFDKSQKLKIIRKPLIANIPFLWPKWLFLLYYTGKIIQKEKIEMIQVGQILPLGTVALIFKKLFKIPYIVYTYGMDITIPQRSGRKLKLIRAILKNSYKVVTISRFTRGELLKLGVDEKKILMVFPGPNITPAILNEELKEEIVQKFNLINKKILLTVGRLVERKGQDMVIKSLPKVLKEIPNIVYIIIGTGPNEYNLLRLVESLNLQNQVIFLKDISNEELAVFYQICDIFIMPTREIVATKDVEGFGIVFLEAGSFGKPVIGGRSGGVEEAIVDKVTGILVDPLNQEEIIDWIIKLFRDKNYMNQLGVQAQERIKREFAWAKQGEKIKEIL